MIYNRTQSDIDTAISVREKLQSGEALTEDDIEALERGTLTINTLNRIEQKQDELKEILNSYWYWNTDGTENKTWSYEDFFKQEDFDRILRNLETLKNAYFVYSSTSVVPNTNYREFKTINSVEHIIYELGKMIDDMKNNFRFCGATECGNN